MTRVVIRIGRLIIRGDRHFAEATFSAELAEAIRVRLATASSSEVGHKLAGSVSHAPPRATAAPRRGSAEVAAAQRLAERLVP